jgi:hypothetical protein
VRRIEGEIRQMSKYLIVDKSILCGTATDRLCQFVKAYNVIISGTLVYECRTTNKERDLMLDRCRKAVLAGGIFSPGTLEVLTYEAQSLRAYGPLVRPQRADDVRRVFRDDPTPFDNAVVAKMSDAEKGFAFYLRDFLGQAKAFLREEDPDALAEEIKRWPNIDESQAERLREYARVCSCPDLRDATNRLLQHIAPRREEYCLSPEWVSWQVIRLLMMWQLERAFQYQARGRMKDKDLCDDWADVQYVTLLSRADGLLMHDLFWQHLAKAAFPEKNVFSSLDEVPDSYRCDWADD